MYAALWNLLFHLILDFQDFSMLLQVAVVFIFIAVLTFHFENLSIQSMVKQVVPFCEGAPLLNEAFMSKFLWVYS